MSILKIAGVFVIAFALNIGSQLLLSLMLNLTQAFGDLPSLAVSAVIAVVVAVLGVVVFNRFVLNRALGSISGANNGHIVPVVALWFLIGLSLIWAVMFIFWIMGLGSFQGYNDATLAYGLGVSICVAVFSGVTEEVLYRYLFYGYMRRVISKMWAALICGVVFGALHLPQVTNALDGFVLIVAAVGVTFLFVAIYEYTNTIWAPAAVHVAWNMFAIKYGFIITNGFDDHANTMAAYAGFHVQSTNKLLVGGSFGVEQSAVAIALYFVTATLIWRLSSSAKFKS
ncbi:CPBP family intramembrane metalloprotease [Rhodobacteraceae bacterium]|nr:CPBP family intramembrane metalloprotease [Paracoccaceae bacterium]